MARLWALRTVLSSSLSSSPFAFSPIPPPFSLRSISSSFSSVHHSSLSPFVIPFLPSPMVPVSPALQHQSISTGCAQAKSMCIGRCSAGKSEQEVGDAGMGRAVAKESVGGNTKFKEREILVQHVLVPEDQLELLLDVQRKVMQEGVDLSGLATEHSTCPSKSVGGMLGWLSRGCTVPEFEEAAFNAPLNKLVRIKTKHGWHLLQVLSEREATFLHDVGVEEFNTRMQDPNFLEEAQLVDVREPDEIATASIEGFETYPLSQFGQWAPTISEDLDPEKDTYVLKDELQPFSSCWLGAVPSWYAISTGGPMAAISGLQTVVQYQGRDPCLLGES